MSRCAAAADGGPSAETPNAVAVVLIEGGRMLTIRRAAGVPRPGFWSPPTGWVEAGECAADAAEREAREELGISVQACREVWRCRSQDPRLLIAWWQVRRLEGELRPAPNEVAELRFVDAAEYLQLAPTFPQHHAFFAEVLPQLLGADGDLSANALP